MLKAIIFDFDGVICESVEVKTDAFRRLFKGYPEHLDEIVAFHMQNGGMSRFRKFEIIYKDILKKPLTEAQSKHLGEKFTEYSYQAVLDSDFVVGASEFLKKNYKKYLLFVVSGTPEDEMIRVVNARGLDRYFKAVYGSPRLKHDLIGEIMGKYHLKPYEVIFVGDSTTDQEGARKSGVDFIGRVHARYPSPFGELSKKNIINDINGLELLLSKRAI